MDLVGDRRGQSIQIGAILLFAALIIAFASYQAFVVPNQNRGVEFNHNQQAQSDMQDLRNAIVSARGTGEGRSVSVQLGTRYPSRLLALNPSPPSGSLRTVGTTDDRFDLTISNAQAAGETGDYWNQSRRFNTGAVVYRPNYNVYRNPPTTVYEQTALYNEFPSGNITLSNQSFIDGTEISVVAINGSLSTSSTRATAVDVRPVSSSTQRVRVRDDGAPITITFTSRRSAAYWDFLEETQSETVASVTNASSGGGFYNVSVELEQGRTYSLQLTKVGVGSGVTDEDAAYLTEIDGDGSTVTQGETTELTLEVRDRFNNPPANRAEMQVNGSVVGTGNGQLDSPSQTPDEDGQVTFVYNATGSAGDQELQFSYTDSGTGLDSSTPQNVSMTVDVDAPPSTGGGGTSVYAVGWLAPTNDNDNGILSDCSASDCTWDVGADSDDVLTLRSGTTPAIEGVNLDFAVNDSSVGTLTPGDNDTGSSGEATTDLTASSNGVVGVYVASGGSSDVINLTVENVSGGGGGGNSAPTASFTTSTTSVTVGEPVDFDASGSSDPDEDSLDYSWDFGDGSGTATVVDPSYSYSSPGTYNVELTVTDGNDADSTTQQITVNPAFSGASVTSIVPDSDGQRQTIRFTVGSAMDSTESVDIDLSSAQGPDRVDYSGGVTIQSGPSGSVGYSTQTTDNAVISYSPSSDLSAGDTVALRVTDIAVGPPGKQANPYSIDFTRTDTGSTTDSFSVAYDDGTANVSGLSATNLGQGTGQTQTISFILESDGLDSGDRVTIDLSDPQSPSAPYVDYASADASVTQGSGSIGDKNTQNSENATVQYTAGSSDAAGDTITIELTDVGTDGTGSYTVGLSREDADTASTNFDVTNQPPTASINATPDPAQTGETITLNASESSDPDGSITSYEWDLDDDGQYDDATGSTTSTSYSTAGDKTIGLRVTDDDSATSTRRQTVTVNSDAAQSISYVGTTASSSNGNDFTFEVDAGGRSLTVRNASIDTTTMPRGVREGLSTMDVTGDSDDDRTATMDYDSDGTRESVDNPTISGETSVLFSNFGSASSGGGPGSSKLPTGSYSFQSTEPSSGNYLTVTLGFTDGSEATFYFVPP